MLRMRQEGEKEKNREKASWWYTKRSERN